MNNGHSDIEQLETQFPMLSGVAFNEARSKALQSGNTVLEVHGDGLYSIAPDGSKTFVKHIEPWVSVTPGTSIKL